MPRVIGAVQTKPESRPGYKVATSVRGSIVRASASKKPNRAGPLARLVRGSNSKKPDQPVRGPNIWGPRPFGTLRPPIEPGAFRGSLRVGGRWGRLVARRLEITVSGQVQIAMPGEAGAKVFLRSFPAGDLLGLAVGEAVEKTADRLRFARVPGRGSTVTLGPGKPGGGGEFWPGTLAS